jgi:hypothetical protein
VDVSCKIWCFFLHLWTLMHVFTKITLFKHVCIKAWLNINQCKNMIHIYHKKKFVQISFPPKHVHLKTIHIMALLTFICIQIQPRYFLTQILHQCMEWHHTITF